MGYYRDNPKWHMYNRPEYPSHKQLIDARHDHLIAKHPNFRIIRAHFGNFEFDVNEVTAHEQIPNFAVDMSARLIDLAIQPSDKVRRFFLHYADRILFGTDVVISKRPSAMTPSG